MYEMGSVEEFEGGDFKKFLPGNAGVADKDNFVRVVLTMEGFHS